MRPSCWRSWHRELLGYRMVVADILTGRGPVPVWWVSLHPEIRARGYADQALIEALLDGSAWRVPLPAFEHHETPPEVPDGGVVVIPARWHANDADVAALAERVGRMAWALIVLTGDEESVFPWRRLLRGPKRRVWVQTPRPDLHADADGLLGDGPWTGTAATLAGVGDVPKTLNWFYSGQVNNPRRQQCVTALEERLASRRDGVLRVTPGFAAGVAHADYLTSMAAARVAPAPSGSFSPDSFRVFEALEAGCVPIVDAGTDKAAAGYWPFVFGGDPPFPVVDDWGRDLDGTVDRVLGDWPAAANRCGAWWMGRKRDLAWRLSCHLSELSGRAPRPSTDERVTVLVPVSPVPTHPSTGILDETLASIRERLPHAEILVMVDGVRAEQEHRRGDYAEAVRRVVWRAHHEWRNVLPVVFDEHLHQAAMAAAVLPMVRTPTVLFVEQDTPLVGDIPFGPLCDAVGSGAANVVRLHHEAAIHPEHAHLMLDRVPRLVAGAPMLRTVQWSQRPHLADTRFYRRMLARYFGAGARSFIEDVMHGIVHNAWRTGGEDGWDRFRVWIYAPDGPMKRSTHLDGRAGDPKYPQTWAYDGPVPEGAPAPRVATVRPPRHGRRPQAKWGLIGRGDRRGLATQTTELARHLEPDRVLGVDMGDLSPYRPDWADYDPERLHVTTLDDLTPEVARRWLTDLAVVVTAETFYRPWFTALCAEMGVRTILAPNPEFFTHVAAADWAPPPDVLAAPTRWRLGEMPGARWVPHGVDRERLPYRPRTKAATFLHVVGHAAKWDRAGTRIVWAAMRWVTEPVRLIVRSQSGASVPEHFPHVTVEVVDGDVPDYWSLYAEGDVMVLPRRYGGLALPAQEALSTGMPVLMPDASPQSGMLPAGMLLPCATERTCPSNVGPLPMHDVDPRVLAARVDQLARNPGEVALLSQQANEVAARLDWAALVDVWCDLIENTATPS